jgi:hypothetical protein
MKLKSLIKSFGKEEEIPNDVQRLFQKSEAVNLNLLSAIERLKITFPLKTVESDELFAIASSLETHSKIYRRQSEANFFKSASDTLKNISRLKMDMHTDIHNLCVEPKMVLSDRNIGEAKRRLQKVRKRQKGPEKIRCFLGKHKRRKSLPLITTEIPSDDIMDTQMEAMRQLLSVICDDSCMAREQCSQSACLLLAMKEFFLKSFEEIEKLDSLIDLKQIASQNPDIKLLRKHVQSSEVINASPSKTLSVPSAKPSSLSKLHVVSSAPSAPMLYPKPKLSLKRPDSICKPQSLYIYKVLYDFKPLQDGDIELLKGDLIELDRPCSSEQWCTGLNKRTMKRGSFPGNYVDFN